MLCVILKEGFCLVWGGWGGEEEVVMHKQWWGFFFLAFLDVANEPMTTPFRPDTADLEVQKIQNESGRGANEAVASPSVPDSGRSRLEE